jgi:hypothetical protein
MAITSLETRIAGGKIGYPLGEDAEGCLIYSHDSFMAASIMRASRTNYASGDLSGGSPEERLAAMDSYSSYCGTYGVKGTKSFTTLN